jgi:hypothetical protein
MNDTTTEIPLLSAAPTNLPLIGFTLVGALCIYLLVKAFSDSKVESSLKSQLFEQTGIDGKYHCQIPDAPRVRIFS